MCKHGLQKMLQRCACMFRTRTMHQYSGAPWLAGGAGCSLPLAGLPPGGPASLPLTPPASWPASPPPLHSSSATEPHNVSDCTRLPLNTAFFLCHNPHNVSDWIRLTHSSFETNHAMSNSWRNDPSMSNTLCCTSLPGPLCPFSRVAHFACIQDSG